MKNTDLPNFMPPEVNDLVLLATEVWRITRKIKKADKILSNDTFKSINISIEKIKVFLKKQGIEVNDFDGSKYNDGLNVDVLSIDDENRDFPIISETIEPMVKLNNKVIKRAKVIVIK